MFSDHSSESTDSYTDSNYSSEMDQESISSTLTFVDDHFAAPTPNELNTGKFKTILIIFKKRFFSLMF